MRNAELYADCENRFLKHFGRLPVVASYAPGRIEVLGNHTDYNEGFVLSAAIDLGIFFVAAPATDGCCRVVAGDAMEEDQFNVSKIEAGTGRPWINYVRGVAHGLQGHVLTPTGFDALFMGNVPSGAGLGSSAALEIATGLALGSLYGARLDPLALARIAQKAEHEFVGVRCGLLDQISSLFGRRECLVLTDFRSLAVELLPLGRETAFLVCHTNVKHALVDGEYNARRKECETAAAYFASVLDHPVRTLRDVSPGEWERHADRMPRVAARRSAHVVGENERVLRARASLLRGDLGEFGRLMFESHESSRVNFENSCPELDLLVSTARTISGVLGARLSGGGFGGSVIVLVYQRDSEEVGRILAAAYQREFGVPCSIRVLSPADGARMIMPSGS
ncbi:MAG: galactokinase [Kiritimatiellae bacterium]|nr:galactokinase [Kiritimatiellia bacterium]